MPKQFVCSSCHYCRRDALYEVSKDTAKDNIYIFEVSPNSLSYFFLNKAPGSHKSICTEPRLRCGMDLRVWHEMVSNISHSLTLIIIVWYIQVPVWHPVLRDGIWVRGKLWRICSTCPSTSWIPWATGSYSVFYQVSSNICLRSAEMQYVIFRQTSMTQSDPKNIEVTVVLGR